MHVAKLKKLLLTFLSIIVLETEAGLLMESK